MLSKLVDINVDDLILRQPIKFSIQKINNYLKGKVILITGAAGSIGAEITRQLSSSELKCLVLVDQAETDLFFLQQEILKTKVNIKAIVGDITDKDRMDFIFEKYKPQIVFHTAAYKHVPLMEENGYEAIKNNLLGTKIVVDISIKHKTDSFMFVSSDKAVYPKNIMGKTKFFAEKYLTSLMYDKHKTKIAITRFGNVLNSNGSVVPIFYNQIKKGGPITITHKDVSRYLISKKEACGLIIEICVDLNKSNTFIFDMGKPVKIVDLAQRMLKQFGANYIDDIKIEFIGLRSGEKMHEIILSKDEFASKTSHKNIMTVDGGELNKKNIIDIINKLCLENNKGFKIDLDNYICQINNEILIKRPK